MSVSEALLEQVARLYADGRNRRRGESDSFPFELWTKVDELGLPLAMCPESSGGSGLRWTEMFDVMAHAASCGEPLPLGETFVGNLILCENGLAPADGPIFFHAPTFNVPATGRLLVVEGGGVRLASPSAGGQPLGTIPAGAGAIAQAGALLRTIQIAGALQGALDLSVRYAQERVQFGRPLSKFQAVQQMLAQLAGEVEAAGAAARTACAKMDAGDGMLAIAISKVRAGLAVQKGAMLAHQIHGAIGVTLEYPLARLSCQMWQWVEEFGGQRYWAATLGRASVGAGSAWDIIVAASDPVGDLGHE